MKKSKLTGTLSVVLAAVLMSTMPAQAIAAVGIQRVGRIYLGDHGGGFSVSADGSTVVGTSDNYQAFRWTQSDGMIGLGWLSGYQGQYPVSYGAVASVDGSVIVGQSSSAYGQEAFRWTQDGGMVGLGDLPGGRYYSSQANDTSADGSVIVGYGYSSFGQRAFRWTQDGGMVELGALQWDGRSYANATSADGSVIVGQSESSLGDQAFRWTADGGMVGLGFLPGPGGYSLAKDISADGLVIVGQGNSYEGQEAFRWTQDRGMVSLTSPHSPDIYLHNSQANAASADGSVIVGKRQNSSGGSQEAFLWTAADGMRSLRDILTADLGFDLTGWDLQDATGISDDGKTIVGSGYDSAGQNIGWVVTLPEPTTVMLLAFGSLALLKRRG